MFTVLSNGAFSTTSWRINERSKRVYQHLSPPRPVNLDRGETLARRPMTQSPPDISYHVNTPVPHTALSQLHACQKSQRQRGYGGGGGTFCILLGVTPSITASIGGRIIFADTGVTADGWPFAPFVSAKSCPKTAFFCFLLYRPQIILAQSLGGDYAFARHECAPPSWTPGRWTWKLVLCSGTNVL